MTLDLDTEAEIVGGLLAMDEAALRRLLAHTVGVLSFRQGEPATFAQLARLEAALHRLRCDA